MPNPAPVSFADLIAEEGRPGGTRCHMGLLLDDLDDDTRAQVEAAFADPRVAGTAIHRALRRLGHDIGLASVQRHKGGGCRCPRSTTS